MTTVTDFLADTTVDKPDKLSIIANDGKITFKELDARSSRVAKALEDAGIKRCEKVAIILGNDQACAFVSSYFGVMKMGGIPVPLNIRWALPEKLYVMEHSDSVAVIAGASHAVEIKDLAKGETIRQDGRPFEIKVRSFWATGNDVPEGFSSIDSVIENGSEDFTPLNPPMQPHDPADLLYTSGTTGLPKGVLVPQENIVGKEGSPNLSSILSEMFGESIIHAVPLFGFTGCHGMMLMTVRSGITQVVMAKFDPETFLRGIEEHRVTSAMAVPTMLNLCMNHPKINDFDYSSLKCILFGAAAISPDTVRKMKDVWPNIMMINAYGLTEGGANAACMLGPNPDDILNHPGSVGVPVNCEVFICDNDNNVLQQGEVGEICFRSEVKRRSYYKADILTTELWDGDMLHTGDVGYIDADGYVYITDRKKDMINRGGYNIFAIEVERVLLEIPEVLEVAVIGVDHEMLGEDLLAVIVPRRGAMPGKDALAPEAINAFCKGHLADYKSPRHVVFIDELPKNAMSKVQKTELRKQFKSYILDQKKELD
ncbi:MAG: class I adenylate-forming enzyme family protein [Spirochaetota bacterium]|nr:class I adenylate-forming enzyme family protein [Spirochaetota bacterium]